METYSPVPNIEMNAGERVGFHFVSEEHFGHAFEMNERFGSVVHVCSSDFDVLVG